MGFLTMLFIGCILGALAGARKTWMGGIAGLLVAPSLFFDGFPADAFSFMTRVLVLSLTGMAFGEISSILLSGLKGGGHSMGQTYMGGFGAHHPGGIILSDDELRILRDRNIKRVEILSY